jgi:hypothetical protein
MQLPSNSRYRLHALFALLMLSAGCKAPPPPIVPAEGIVLLDGVPLNNAEVRFIPMIEYGPEYIARGITGKDGRFTLTCKGEAGACACENRVLVVEADLPDRVRGANAQAELAEYLKSLGPRPPQKYGNLVDSPLVMTVSASQGEYKLELTREEPKK